MGADGYSGFVYMDATIQLTLQSSLRFLLWRRLRPHRAQEVLWKVRIINDLRQQNDRYGSLTLHRVSDSAGVCDWQR
jgi:hypothetical protein